MFINYSEEELQNIINTKIEENLHLEYKSAGSLEGTDSKKLEISKDVSAFANSDGGIIIYGIKEFSEKDKKHLPEKITPIDRSLIPKEWLEQVINSNIQPKIDGLIIKPISLNANTNEVAYVVEIPKSNTVHQSGNKTYYKRRNFIVDTMEDYEIRDVMNRLSSPKLELILINERMKFSGDILEFPIIINNYSLLLARDVKVLVEFFGENNFNFINCKGFISKADINNGKKVYIIDNTVNIYNGVNTVIGSFKIKLNTNILNLEFRVTILGDNMFPIKDNINIKIKDNIPKYIST
ncbi:ATP-binding protein [Candidatus Gracilibacteria bacterium]|nr:ATP-binding protein [Candidatus Gracilibacteria bacterium]